MSTLDCFAHEARAATNSIANDDYVPIVLASCAAIQGQIARTKPFVCLLDSGAKSSWISHNVLPKGVNPRTVEATRNSTLAGVFTSKLEVHLQQVKLPEFSRSHKYDSLTAKVFHSQCGYDAILGRDFLNESGIKLDFEEKTVTWVDVSQPLVCKNSITTFKDVHDLRDTLYHDLYDEIDGLFDDDDLFQSSNPETGESDNSGYKSKNIKPSLYAEFDVRDVAQGCKHLSQDQRNELESLLLQFPKLFSGKLGHYPHEKVHLDVDPNATPKHQRAYPVPHRNKEVFKGELDRLCEIGVLEKTGRSEWASPTFITPKKDGRVRWVSDFRALNKVIKRKQYPLPRIADIFARRCGYAFFTKLDISMQYYTFELDDESKDLCTIATPFGLYRYKRLPMGISQSPDVAQEIMEKTLADIADTEVYVDDVGCWNGSWQEHLATLRRVLQRLEDNGFTINPLKCEWGVKETDFLGHWLTPYGIKPWRKKVDAIIRMERPTNLKELRSFLGMVTYYRDMWPKRSHILAPLTDLTGATKFAWSDKCQKAFERMKAVVAQEALLHFPDHNLPFDIESDSSDYQLGAVIKQNGHPVAYYTRKLNSAQRNYTTIEKELLSIVETFKTFRTMLLGARITVHSDHRNLTHELTAFTSQRVLRWRLLLEEFNPTFHHVPGATNKLADALSRVPTGATSSEGKPPSPSNDRDQDGYCMLKDDPSLADCLLVYPEFDETGRHPFHFGTIREYQQNDNEWRNAWQLAAQKAPEQHVVKNFNGVELLCYAPKSKPSAWKIAIPTIMLPKLVAWYHLTLAHAEGMTRLGDTISAHFYHPKLHEVVRQIVGTCDACQRLKIGHRQYGELPPRQVPLSPWSEIHCDLIGPWKVTVNGIDLYFNALTVIDPVTNLLEIYRLSEKTALYVGMQLQNGWIARYPRPLRCIHDQGPEFMGQDFIDILEHAGIEDVPTAKKAPTSNAICQRIHQTVAQVLATLMYMHPPEHMMHVSDMVDSALATAMHATRCAVSRSLYNLSPGAIAFQRDMLLDIPLIADILTLQQHREALVNERLLKANSQRVSHDYQVGEQVLIREDKPNKLAIKWKGPYRIERVHVNGNVTLRKKPNLTERINIHRIKPYRSPP